MLDWSGYRLANVLPVFPRHQNGLSHTRRMTAAMVQLRAATEGHMHLSWISPMDVLWEGINDFNSEFATP